MSGQPLLISSLMDYAAKFHPDVEVVTRDVDDPDTIHRYTYGDAAGRMMQLANALRRLGVEDGASCLAHSLALGCVCNDV